MPNHIRSILAPTLASVLLALQLCGCGGGGGGSGGNSPPPPPPAAMTLSPKSVSTTITEGSTAGLTVTYRLTQAAFDAMDHIEFDDIGDGQVTDAYLVQSNGNLSATVEFQSYGLTQGQYSGTINFYLCKDSSCRTTVDGSPFVLPYTIKVDPAPPPPPPPPPPPAPVVTPNPLLISVEANDQGEISIRAQVSETAAVYFGVNDPQGRFQNDTEFLSQVGSAYNIRLRTLAISTPGNYTGTLTLWVCDWSPCTSGTQGNHSAATVPYTITVTPEVLLQPVPTVSGLPEWETFQGNAGHTGHVPVTLDASRFVPRWSWSLPSGSTTTLRPVTAGSGKVFVSASGYFITSTLYALNEFDGSLAWKHDFGDVFALNDPAAWGGRVFVATSGHEDTAMWSLDIADGTVKFRTDFDAQWEHYLAPTVKNGYVYTNGGYYGGMYAFKGATGAQRFFAGLEQYDLWTPAVDDTQAYAYAGYNFFAVNRLTGERTVTIRNNTFNWSGYSLNMSPVLPGDGSVLVVDGVFNNAHSNHLIRYDPTQGGEWWRVDGTFTSNPVVSGSTVYVLNSTSNQLEARDLATGAIRWTWVVGNAQESLPVGNLVLTDNLIFVSTNVATYAIDLATHQPVWSTAHVGSLAISSNKVLYIVKPSAIEAFSLF